tara:strand:+ start:119 stop:889 length:771 start_codon:yes stop_codon:yes gene_type:complete
MIIKFILIFLLLLILINLVCYKKRNVNVIPKHVYQTWRDSNIPKNIEEGMISLRKKNPELEFHFFDDNACRDFIEKYFGNRVLNAYNTLIPGAYKADLWRYCIMYIKGGIYIDIKYDTVDDFKLNTLTDQEYYIRDIHAIKIGYGEEYVYNALLVSKPGNEIYKKCIDRIVKNVENRDYCKNDLDITGPSLLKTILDENEKYLKTRKYNYEYKHIENGDIYNNEKLILKIHKRDEYYKTLKNNSYGVLWNKKQVFN